MPDLEARLVRLAEGREPFGRLRRRSAGDTLRRPVVGIPEPRNETRRVDNIVDGKRVRRLAGIRTSPKLDALTTRLREHCGDRLNLLMHGSMHGMIARAGIAHHR